MFVCRNRNVRNIQYAAHILCGRFSRIVADSAVQRRLRVDVWYPFRRHRLAAACSLLPKRQIRVVVVPAHFVHTIHDEHARETLVSSNVECLVAGCCVAATDVRFETLEHTRGARFQRTRRCPPAQSYPSQDYMPMQCTRDDGTPWHTNDQHRNPHKLAHKSDDDDGGGGNDASTKTRSRPHSRPFDGGGGWLSAIWCIHVYVVIYVRYIMLNILIARVDGVIGFAFVYYTHSPQTSSRGGFIFLSRLRIVWLALRLFAYMLRKICVCIYPYKCVNIWYYIHNRMRSISLSVSLSLSWFSDVVLSHHVRLCVLRVFACLFVQQTLAFARLVYLIVHNIYIYVYRHWCIYIFIILAFGIHFDV